MLIESHRYIIQVSKHWLMLSFTGRSKQMFGRAHSVDLLPPGPTQCQFVMYSRTSKLRNAFRDVEGKSTSHKGFQAMNQFPCQRIFHISNYLHVVVYDQQVAHKMMHKFCHIIWRYLKLLKLSGCATNWLVELPKHLGWCPTIQGFDLQSTAQIFVKDLQGIWVRLCLAQLNCYKRLLGYPGSYQRLGCSGYKLTAVLVDSDLNCFMR